jgi:hypothetical protein
MKPVYYRGGVDRGGGERGAGIGAVPDEMAHRGGVQIVEGAVSIRLDTGTTGVGW